MLIEVALARQLLDTVNVTALVVDRVYPVRLPQGGDYPAITYSKVSGGRIRTMGSNEAAANPRVQVSCWGKTYADAKGLANAVRIALDRFSGTLGGSGGVAVSAILLENELDLDDPETKLYHVPLDFLVWYTEAP